jgi:hypothetical protein
MLTVVMFVCTVVEETLLINQELSIMTELVRLMVLTAIRCARVGQAA